MKRIEDFTLNALMEMREDAKQGRKTRFTIAEINAESDRRHRLNTPFDERNL